MFERPKRPAWAGKDCYCSQGVGAGDKQGGEKLWRLSNNLGELTRIYGTLWAECPQEGCHNVVEVPNGAPEYIVPEKQDNAAGTVAADLPMVSLIETLRTMGGGIIPLPQIQANSTNRSDT